jgi:peptidoglycan/LPS O-acetylase OafA/YrhL
VFVPTAALVSIAAGLAFHRLIERPLIAAVRRLPGLLALASPRPPAGAVGQPTP